MCTSENLCLEQSPLHHLTFFYHQDILLFHLTTKKMGLFLSTKAILYYIPTRKLKYHFSDFEC